MEVPGAFALLSGENGGGDGLDAVVDVLTGAVTALLWALGRGLFGTGPICRLTVARSSAEAGSDGESWAIRYQETTALTHGGNRK